MDLVFGCGYLGFRVIDDRLVVYRVDEGGEVVRGFALMPGSTCW